jgi:histidine ammonia-lyase
MLLLAGAQAVDLRGGAEKLGSGSRRMYGRVRQIAGFQEQDGPLELEVAALAAAVAAGEL